MQDTYRVWILVTAALVLAAVAPGSVLAQESDKLQVSVKVGAALAPTYEGSDNYRGVPIGSLRLSNLYHPNTYVQLNNTTLTSNLLPDNNWRLGPLVQYIPNRGNVSDSAVDNLQHVDSSVLLGALVGYDFKLPDRQVLGLEFQGRQDVSSNDQGYLLTLLGRYVAPFQEKWTFASELSSTYASSDYMDAYFGVSGRNAERSGLDQFTADAGIKDVTLRLGVDYALFGNLSLGVTVGYSRLFNDAKDSPLVDDRGDENQAFGGLTVGYKF